MEKKVVLITGASSGIGYETAKILAKQGHIVYGTSRDINRVEKIEDFNAHSLALDVTDEESCKKCLKEIISKEGRIDVLINNAGYGLYGPIEMVDIKKAKEEFEVNVYGAIRMTKLVISYMRKQKSGRIINISSAAGRVSTFLGGWYHASKFALEALSDSLRMELKRFGIRVIIIEPGGIKSNWGIISSNYLYNSGKNSPYEKECTKISNVYKEIYENSKLLTSPKVVAKKILKAVNKKNPKTRYLFGFGAKPMVFLHAILPSKVFDLIMIKMYNLAK